MIAALTQKFHNDPSFAKHVEKLNAESQTKYVPSLTYKLYGVCTMWRPIMQTVAFVILMQAAVAGSCNARALKSSFFMLCLVRLSLLNKNMDLMLENALKLL